MQLVQRIEPADRSAFEDYVRDGAAACEAGEQGFEEGGVVCVVWCGVVLCGLVCMR